MFASNNLVVPFSLSAADNWQSVSFDVDFANLAGDLFPCQCHEACPALNSSSVAIPAPFQFCFLGDANRTTHLAEYTLYFHSSASIAVVEQKGLVTLQVRNPAADSYVEFGSQVSLVLPNPPVADRHDEMVMLELSVENRMMGIYTVPRAKYEMFAGRERADQGYNCAHVGCDSETSGRVVLIASQSEFMDFQVTYYSVFDNRTANNTLVAKWWRRTSADDGEWEPLQTNEFLIRQPSKPKQKVSDAAEWVLWVGIALIITGVTFMVHGCAAIYFGWDWDSQLAASALVYPPPDAGEGAHVQLLGGGDKLKV